MNILLTSVGRRSYLIQYFKDAMKEEGTVHASNSTWSPALQIADQYTITPLIYDENYIDFILDYCLSKDISAIIPLFDIDLPVLAKNKDTFYDYGIEVVVSDYETTKLCNDKYKTYEFLKKNNINTPKSFISFEKAIMAIEDDLISFPVVVKPRWGAGSILNYTAVNMAELEVFYKKIHRELPDTYLLYESKRQLNSEIIIQEKILGEEFGLDVINDLKGGYITTFVKKKLAMRAGETDVALTVNNPHLEKIGKAISLKLFHKAIVDVDCFIDNNSNIYVIEINCRFGGHYPFSHLAGSNVPLAILKWLRDETAEEELFLLKVGVKCFKELQPKLKKQN